MASEPPHRAPPAPFQIDVRGNGDTTRLVVSGELDLATATRMRAAVIAHALEGRTLEVDLSALGFLDSSGLQVLLYAQKAAVADGWRLRIIAPAGPAREVLSISGVARVLPVVDAT